MGSCNDCKLEDRIDKIESRLDKGDGERQELKTGEAVQKEQINTIITVVTEIKNSMNKLLWGVLGGFGAIVVSVVGGIILYLVQRGA